MWLLLMWCVFAKSMDNDPDIETGLRKISHEECNDEDLAQLALLLYFSDNECEVIKEIKEHLKERISKIKEEDAEESEVVIKRLEEINRLASNRHHSIRHKIDRIESQKELKHVINTLVIDAVQQYGESKDRMIKYFEQRAATKERHKRWAIAAAIISFVIGAASTLSSFFIEH